MRIADPIRHARSASATVWLVAIRALFFDFDGTLWDSEVASFRAWQELYEEHGAVYELAVYALRLGTVGGVDPIDQLEQIVGRPLNHHTLEERRWRRKLELLEGMEPRPGVVDYITEARARGFALAIVSTDSPEWVLGGLERLGLADRWDLIECAEGDLARAKPAPALYRSALDRLQLAVDEAIAIEDSPNGVLAAKRADLFCLAVSHELSEQLDLSRANLVIRSLTELPLAELVRRAETPS